MPGAIGKWLKIMGSEETTGGKILARDRISPQLFVNNHTNK
jgi:hypothetical protein